MMRWLLFALVFLASPAAAADCRDVRHNGNSFTICEVDPQRETLQLFLRDETGQVLGSFAAVNRQLAADGKTLSFAMNAGMYHSDRSPVGLYLHNGVQEMRLVPNAGPGNFGLLPNGVFCISKNRVQVIETLAYQANGAQCTYATQSGPMLVIDGALHPRFLPDSTSRYVRNGVGTNRAGTRAVFAISNNAVTFHEFGSLFRDYLKLPNALYFDGSVSRLFAPTLGRSDIGRRLGPIVGVVQDGD